MATGSGEGIVRAGRFGPVDALQLAATLAAMPLLCLGLALRPAWRRGLPSRLGIGCPGPGPKPRLWAHGASVGEIEGLIPFVCRWRESYPGGSVVVTSSTPTGRDAALRAFGLDVQASLLPLDVAGLVDRVVRRVAPDLFVFSENELWPQMLRALAAAGVPAVQVSGRVSASTVRALRYCPPLRGRMVGAVDLHCVQTATDRDHLLEMGVASERIVAAGSLKGERTIAVLVGPLALALAAEKRPVVVAGSSHAGEEGLILEAVRQARARGIDALWIIAPRHPERFEEVRHAVAMADERWIARSALASTPSGVGDAVAGSATLSGRQLPLASTPTRATAETPGGSSRSGRQLPLASTPSGVGDAVAALSPVGPGVLDGISVLVLDSLGELAAVYARASVAIVGGTFVPIGGHNALEPASAGVPVVVGPHHDRIRPVIAALEAAGAARVVTDAPTLVETVATFLRPKGRAGVSQAARRVAEGEGGALLRTWRALEERSLLPPPQSAQPGNLKT